VHLNPAPAPSPSRSNNPGRIKGKSTLFFFQEHLLCLRLNGALAPFVPKEYSIETRLAAVNAYLDGVESIRKVAKKFNISKTMLHRWVGKLKKMDQKLFK
jgi:hypothetical protein